MKYMFPFQDVPYGSRVVIYGAGRVGQEYLYQVREINNVEVVCMADLFPERYAKLGVDVIQPEEIFNYEFDYVILATRLNIYARDMKQKLLEIGIPEEKIVSAGKEWPDIAVLKDTDDFVPEEGLAYQNEKGISIAIQMGGGFGDLIVYKRLLEEVLSWDEDLLVDVYVKQQQRKFMEGLLANTHNIGSVVGCLEQWQVLKDKYVAAFSFGNDLDMPVCHWENISEKKQLRNLLKDIYHKCLEYGEGMSGL